MTSKNILTIMNSIEKTTDALDKEHGCGWFDGGCFTLALTIKELFPDAVIYYVSRTNLVVDHAVVYLPEIDAFIDADGVQSKQELLTKMHMAEGADIKVCEPLCNIFAETIYFDIRDMLKNEFLKELSKDKVKTNIYSELPPIGTKLLVSLSGHIPTINVIHSYFLHGMRVVSVSFKNHPDEYISMSKIDFYP